MKLVVTAVTLALLSFGAYAAGADTNNDGKISTQELKACDFDSNMIVTKDEAKKCGLTDAQWKMLDKDQSGKIEANEINAAG